jgi:hypothetical protein
LAHLHQSSHFVLLHHMLCGAHSGEAADNFAGLFNAGKREVKTAVMMSKAR